MNELWFWGYLSSKDIEERKQAYWLTCLKEYSDPTLPLRWDRAVPILEGVEQFRHEYECQFRWHHMLGEAYSQLSLAERQSISLPEQPYSETDITNSVAQIRKVYQERGWWGKIKAWVSSLFPTRVAIEGKSICSPDELDQMLQVLKVADLPREYYLLEVLQEQSFLDIVRVPAGEFLQGSEQAPSMSPVHPVEISEPLLVGKHPVSRSLFSVIMFDEQALGVTERVEEDKPIVGVPWIKAIEFCNRLSEECGYSPAYVITNDSVEWLSWSEGWRLLTESEWEYCATAGRSGLQKVVPMWSSNNSNGLLPKLSQNPPNAFGLHDMLGLVWEWCWDAFDVKYYEDSPKINPCGPDEFQFTGEHISRVKRGGSFKSPARKISAHRRSHTIYHIKEDYIGIRVCRRFRE